jgi:hypothetical protein
MSVSSVLKLNLIEADCPAFLSVLKFSIYMSSKTEAEEGRESKLKLMFAILMKATVRTHEKNIEFKRVANEYIFK